MGSGALRLPVRLAAYEPSRPHCDPRHCDQAPVPELDAHEFDWEPRGDWRAWRRGRVEGESRGEGRGKGWGDKRATGKAGPVKMPWI